MTPEEKEFHRAHARRAVDRAKTAMQPGDIMQYTLCGGACGRAKFLHWNGNGACGAYAEVHPINIFKINGELVSFRDDNADPRYPEKFKATP